MTLFLSLSLSPPPSLPPPLSLPPPSLPPPLSLPPPHLSLHPSLSLLPPPPSLSPPPPPSLSLPPPPSISLSLSLSLSSHKEQVATGTQLLEAHLAEARREGSGSLDVVYNGSGSHVTIYRTRKAKNVALNTETICTANGCSETCNRFIWQFMKLLVTSFPSLVQCGNARLVFPFCPRFDLYVTMI